MADTAIAQYLSTSQVGRKLEVSQETVRKWIDSGKLDAIATTLGHLISPDSVERLMESRR